jgi:hypothetical protein
MEVTVMNISDITKDTKIGELSKEYPWLIDEVKKLSSRAANLNSGLIKIILARATIGDIAKKVDEKPELLIEKLKELIEAHQG